jgi:hypothetical protein
LKQPRHLPRFVVRTPLQAYCRLEVRSHPSDAFLAAAAAAAAAVAAAQGWVSLLLVVVVAANDPPQPAGN